MLHNLLITFGNFEILLLVVIYAGSFLLPLLVNYFLLGSMGNFNILMEIIKYNLSIVIILYISILLVNNFENLFNHYILHLMNIINVSILIYLSIKIMIEQLKFFPNILLYLFKNNQEK